MSDATYNMLREAVRNKQQVLCRYQGYDREMCPHVLGLKAGREKVLSFQFGGDSSKGLPPEGEWRCMFVEQIEHVTLRPGAWHTSHSHTRPQTCVDEIDVEVPY